MARGLTILGMVVAVLLLILFIADLVARIPFGRYNLTLDIAFVICALVLSYLSWSTWRELE